ncbi:hypothetical protein MRB53_039363 [Persea americana]|nr:hypothetical protein MRB53_039363 [Persea americana]
MKRRNESMNENDLPANEKSLVPINASIATWKSILKKANFVDACRAERSCTLVVRLKAWVKDKLMKMDMQFELRLARCDELQSAEDVPFMQCNLRSRVEVIVRWSLRFALSCTYV